MRTSNKILLAGAASPILSVFILALILKMLPLEIKSTDTAEVDKSSWTTRIFPLEEFHGISSKGIWEIHLVQGDDYLVEIKAPEDMFKMISVNRMDQTLLLDYAKAPEQLQDRPNINALIHLPYLSEINVQGASYLYLSGITTDSVSIHSEGLLKLLSADCTIENLSFTGNGMSRLDLSETPVTNADIQCGGLFSIDILMNGGYLIGMIDGFGTFTFEGNVSENKMIATSPLIKVVHR